MTLSWTNALFACGMGLVVGLAVLAVGLGIDAWRDRERRAEPPADPAVPEAVRPIVEAAKAFQSLSKTLRSRPRRNDLDKDENRG